jgi:hypothetical protein
MSTLRICAAVQRVCFGGPKSKGMRRKAMDVSITRSLDLLRSALCFFGLLKRRSSVLDWSPVLRQTVKLIFHGMEN